MTSSASHKNGRSGRGGRTLRAGVVTLLVVMGTLGLMGVGALSQDVRAASVTGSGYSDASGLPYLGGTLSWTHTPVGAPTLVTLVCAAQNAGIALAATYGGAAMTTAVTNQQSSFYVGMFYLNYPLLGAQTVNVQLTATSGTTTTNVECSATTWTGAAGVDTSIASTNQVLSGAALSLSISPKATVPANEVFFSALHRYEWGAGTTLSVSGSPSGVGASIVDSNTNAGTGTNYGCQLVPNSGPDYDCIGSAQLLSGGTSMTFSWSTGYGADAVAAGFGIKALPLVVSGWTGWYGNNNEVIYMTTGLTDTGNPYILPTVSTVNDQTTNTIGNAIEFRVGRAVSTTYLDLIPHYYFDSKAGGMQIWLTYSAASGTKVAKDLLGSGDVAQVYWQKETVTGFTGTQQNIISTYNSGINSTWGSTTDIGSASSSELMAIYNLTWDAMGFLPGVSYVTGGYSVMRDFEKLVGVDSSLGVNLDSSNGQSSYETFDIPMGLDCSQEATLGYCTVANQQVFAPQWYTYATIGLAAFTTQGSFVTSASNTLGNAQPSGLGYSITPLATCSGCISPQGAIASVSIPAVPAVTFEGHVSDSNTGQLLGGATVHIKATSGSDSGTEFQVTTGSGGNYRFFAQVGTTYTVWATYTTSYSSTASSSVSMYDASPTYQWANFTIAVPSGGGGGCVLAGTLISTPNGGQKRVEQLSQGDAVLGYNVTSGSWVKESVTSNTATKVNEVLSINGGLLETTLTDQPLFVRNGTWTGWVHDPRNLSVGEQLNDPWTGSWVNITSLQVLQGNFKVYDLRATAPNNFVANGVLADSKCNTC